MKRTGSQGEAEGETLSRFEVVRPESIRIGEPPGLCCAWWKRGEKTDGERDMEEQGYSPELDTVRYDNVLTGLAPGLTPPVGRPGRRAEGLEFRSPRDFRRLSTEIRKIQGGSLTRGAGG
ncbi:hypothetical protein KM043_016260 [Ampulex compressa]|nr:hypothetical protein KM043_016260 [Ampulex compressa]